MTRKFSNRQPADDEAGRQERKGRRLIWLGAAGIAALVAAVVYVNLGPSRALRVSKETTYITEPLKSDGKQVDYFAAIRQATRPENAATDENGYRLIVQRLGKARETEHRYFVQVCEQLGLDAHMLRPDMTYQEPSDLLDAYINGPQFDEALLDRYSPKRGCGYEVKNILVKKLDRPWTLNELPMMAAWLEQNGPALDLIGRAVRQPTFHVPLGRRGEEESLFAVLLPEFDRLLSFAQGLSARARHRIATGDIDGAIDDVITCKRLGRHAGNGPFLSDVSVGTLLEGIADAIGIAGSLEHPPAKEQLERLLAELGKLPPPAALDDQIARERLLALDFFQSISHGNASWDDRNAPYFPPAPIFEEMSVDWNLLAHRFNQLFDDMLTTGNAPCYVGLTPGNAAPLVFVRARSEFLAEQMVAAAGSRWHYMLEDTRRRECTGQMQHIVLAMLLYERDHGTLPPAWSADAAGNPLHSWRVLLLPYLGHRDLYDRIRLDEPWDSPHNRQFHAEAVSFYRCPGHPLAGRGETTYSVVVGPDMPFEAGEGKKLADFSPLSDDMILVVERTDPVGWMEPTRDVTQADAELGIHPQRPVLPPGRLGHWHERSNFALRNGAVRALPYYIDTALLKDLLRGTNAEKGLDFLAWR